MMNNPYHSPTEPPASSHPRSPVGSPALPFWVYLLCGWPILLVVIGGLLGGALGGGAYGLNMMIWKSTLPLAARVPLILVVGAGAVGVWFIIAITANFMLR